MLSYHNDASHALSTLRPNKRTDFTSNGKILFVDDNPEIREVLRLLLTCEGYETIEASNGIDTLKLMNDTIEQAMLSHRL